MHLIEFTEKTLHYPFSELLEYPQFTFPFFNITILLIRALRLP